MQIPINSVGIKARKHTTNILKRVSKIIDRGIFLNGVENNLLTRNLQKYFKKGLVVLTASGHDALLLAIESLDLTGDNEIIFPVNSYPTAFPIALSKAVPVPVDVNDNGLLDVKKVAKKITKKTRVIIAVHLYGLIADIKSLKRLIGDKKIYIIEDAAQAFGSRLSDKPAGVFGDISCFSFYPTKNLGAFGDGGALWTKNKSLYKRFLKAVSYGETKRYKSDFVSGHSRIPEIQAGILNIYFQEILKEARLKKEKLTLYLKFFQKAGLLDKIRILYQNNSPGLVLQSLVVEVKKRDQLKKFLAKRGIGTQIHYPSPIHLQKAFSYLGYKMGDFPGAERLSKNILSLPYHPFITQNEVKYIVESIADFYNDKL